jgi:hypothetical protein
MSNLNLNSRSSRIEFGCDHTRLSPSSSKDLRALEPVAIFKIIRAVYENKPLFTQLSRDWQRKLRKVRYFTEDDYVPNEHLLGWVGFIDRVLIPKENGWQKEQMRRTRARNTINDSALLGLLSHPSLMAYSRRQELLGQAFDPLSATNTDICEALRWCDAHSKITHNGWFNDYSNQKHIQDLSQLSFLQLCDLQSRLSFFARLCLLRAEIRDNPDSENLLTYNIEYRLEKDETLEDKTEAELRIIKAELASMQKTGLSYNNNGELISKL